MKQIVYEEQTKNFRISHIVQKNAYDMSKRHIHMEYELYYLIQGERYYFIDSKYLSCTIQNGYTCSWDCKRHLQLLIYLYNEILLKIKINELLIHTTLRVNFKKMLSERSQLQH